jgi:hypothetical protein
MLVARDTQAVASKVLGNSERVRTATVAPDYAAAEMTTVDPARMKTLVGSMDSMIRQDKTGQLSPILQKARNMLVDKPAVPAVAPQRVADGLNGYKTIPGKPAVPETYNLDIANLDRAKIAINKMSELNPFGADPGAKDASRYLTIFNKHLDAIMKTDNSPRMTVYHGGNLQGSPNLSFAGKNSGIQNEPAFWVTSSEKSAKDFADGAAVNKMNISPKNPLSVDVGVHDIVGDLNKVKVDAIQKAKANGNDAIIFKYPNGLADEIAVLDVNILGANNPSAYAKAVAEFKKASPAVDNLQAGTLGTIANTAKPVEQWNALIGPDVARTGTVTQAAQKMSAVDPETYRKMVKLGIENDMNAALGLKSPLNQNVGWSVAKAWFSNPQRSANVREAIGNLPNGAVALDALDNVMKVLRQTGLRQSTGSPTASNAANVGALSGEQNLVQSVISDPIFGGPQALKVKFSMRSATKLAKILTDPDKVELLRKIAAYNPMEPYAQAGIIGILNSEQSDTKKQDQANPVTKR